MRNNSTKQKGKKKNSTSHYRSEFRAQWYGGIKVTKKGWTALKRKARCTLHAGMVSEGFANFIPKEDRPANSLNPVETIWIIVDETTYVQPSKHWTS